MIPALIFLCPFMTALMVPFFHTKRSVSQILTLAALAGSFFFSLKGLSITGNGSVIHHYMGNWTPPYGIEWRLDTLSAFMSLLVSALAFIVIFATGVTVEKECTNAKIPYYTIVLLHVASLLGIILTHDLFNLFVFLEVASLTAYALVASGNDTRGNVASFRYLLIGTAGASFYLLGVGYLYAATGTLNMTDMALRLQELGISRTVFLGVTLILIGLAIKMGLFPFHGWLPDAYTHASDSASALIAPLMTKVMIYSFIRIVLWVIGRNTLTTLGIGPILTVFGTLAIVAGSIMAFMQRRFKRLLAYSSISHIGLIMLAFGLGNKTALIGAFLHILNHACMKAALFLVAATAYHRHGIDDIFDFSKLRGKMPYTMAAFCVAALSMVGIPPLAGFFGKWYILVGSLQAGKPIFAVLVVLSSLLTALYFFKVIEQTFFHRQKENVTVQEGPLALVISTGSLAIGLLILGYFAPAIFHWGFNLLVPAGVF